MIDDERLLRALKVLFVIALVAAAVLLAAACDTDHDTALGPRELPEGYTALDACALRDVDELAELWGSSWSTSGQAAVWCDLPGSQAELEGRTFEIPLNGRAYSSWELCRTWYDLELGDQVACAGLDSRQVGPTWSPVLWTCDNGREVEIGNLLTFDCEQLEQAGDPAYYVVVRWHLE